MSTYIKVRKTSEVKHLTNLEEEINGDFVSSGERKRKKEMYFFYEFERKKKILP